MMLRKQLLLVAAFLFLVAGLTPFIGVRTAYAGGPYVNTPTVAPNVSGWCWGLTFSGGGFTPNAQIWVSSTYTGEIQCTDGTSKSGSWGPENRTNTGPDGTFAWLEVHGGYGSYAYEFHDDNGHSVRVTMTTNADGSVGSYSQTSSGETQSPTAAPPVVPQQPQGLQPKYPNAQLPDGGVHLGSYCRDIGYDAEQHSEGDAYSFRCVKDQQVWYINWNQACPDVWGEARRYPTLSDATNLSAWKCMPNQGYIDPPRKPVQPNGGGNQEGNGNGGSDGGNTPATPPPQGSYPVATGLGTAFGQYYAYVPSQYDSLFLRSTPEARQDRSNVMGFMNPGDYYSIVDVTNGWAKVNTSLGQGWVSTQYAQVVDRRSQSSGSDDPSMPPEVATILDDISKGTQTSEPSAQLTRETITYLLEHGNYAVGKITSSQAAQIANTIVEVAYDCGISLLQIIGNVSNALQGVVPISGLPALLARAVALSATTDDSIRQCISHIALEPLIEKALNGN